MKRLSLILCVFSIVFCSINVLAQVSGQFYLDKAGIETNESVINQKFTNFNETINEGLNTGIYWVKIPSLGKHYLTINSARNLSIQCFQNNKERALVSHTLMPTFRLNPNQAILLKVNCENEAFIPFSAFGEDEYLKYKSFRLALVGFYYGVAIMVLIFNLFYFFSFKDKAFLLYVLFLLGISISLFYSDGGMRFFYGSSWLATNGLVVLHPLAVTAGSVFASHYLNHRLHMPKLKLLTIPLVIAMFLLFASYLVTNVFSVYAMAEFVALTLLVVYWLSGVFLFQKNAYSRFFTIAYSIILVLAADYYVSPVMGWNFLGVTHGLLKLGGFFEMLVLSYAVIFRMQILHKESEEMKNALFSYINQVDQLEKELEKIKLGEQNTMTKAKLSNKEINIIDLISKGKTNKEIAQELFISVNTVKYHTKKLYDKLNIKSRREIEMKMVSIQ